MSLIQDFYNSQWFLLVVITLAIWIVLAIYVTWAYNQVHAATTTRQEYNEVINTAQKINDAFAKIRNETAGQIQPLTFEQFCALYEQNSSNHCIK